MDQLKAAAWEAIKEGGRITALALVSYLLTGGISVVVHALFGQWLTPEMEVSITGVLTIVLKSVDKWLHEFGKATENMTLTKGLTQF